VKVTSEGSSVLTLEDVTARYGVSSGDVLSGVSFTAERNNLVTLLGPNGAGKSTILRTISGLLIPSSGEITFDGERITERDPQYRVKHGIGHVPEGRELFGDMSVEENLLTAASRADNEAIADMYDMFPILDERREQTAKSLSGGEQQMLSFAQALITEPELLLLDEPTLGLAPQVIDDVFAKVEELKQTDVTILLAEQFASHALAVADRIVVVNNGQIVYQGDPDEIAGEEDLFELYTS
jgi:branched-chain amino acid transport system ATP-binding protein